MSQNLSQNSGLGGWHRDGGEDSRLRTARYKDKADLHTSRHRRHRGGGAIKIRRSLSVRFSVYYNYYSYCYDESSYALSHLWLTKTVRRKLSSVSHAVSTEERGT